MVDIVNIIFEKSYLNYICMLSSILFKLKISISVVKAQDPELQGEKSALFQEGCKALHGFQ